MRTEPMKRVAGDPDKMNLPEGKTCRDCAHFRRCNAMFSHIAGDEVCDFYPLAFVEAIRPAAIPGDQRCDAGKPLPGAKCIGCGSIADPYGNLVCGH